MKVTPEMLLFLAGKMGLNGLSIDDGAAWYLDPFGTEWPFGPQHDKAQFAEVVLWAAEQGILLMLGALGVAAKDCSARDSLVELGHDNTPAGIMEATVVATCRALGWEDVCAIRR